MSCGLECLECSECLECLKCLECQCTFWKWLFRNHTTVCCRPSSIVPSKNKKKLESPGALLLTSTVTSTVLFFLLLTLYWLYILFSICLCSNAKSSLVYLLLLPWKYHDSYIRSCKYFPVLRITYWLSTKKLHSVWSLDVTILPLKALVQQSAIHYKYFTSVILYTYQDTYNCDPSEIYLRAYFLGPIL